MNNISLHAKRTPAFTIMEILVVIVIIGVLAAIALPSYNIQMRKMKNQEAVRILTAVWEAQKDYYRENGVYTNDIANLAIDTAFKNFYNLDVLPAPSVMCNNNQPYLAKLTANDNSYRLYALEDGRIVCTPCPGSLCAKMGFPEW